MSTNLLVTELKKGITNLMLKTNLPITILVLILSDLLNTFKQLENEIILKEYNSEVNKDGSNADTGIQSSEE